jgi:hypothetical protein
MLLATLVPALADSDGYYCTGPGFVAYQFNNISVATEGHVLTVIRVGTESGIAEPLTITLPSFQVHGMKCNHESVELRGWSTVHLVEFSDSGDLRIGPVIEIPPETRLQGFGSENLGDWSRSATVPIESTDPEQTYELVVRKREENMQPAGVLHHTTTELVRRAHNGQVVERRLLYEGTFEETVD